MYAFSFDGPIVPVSDQQPGGGSGSGDGYSETFDVLVNSTDAAVIGLHFDLFTYVGDGTYANNTEAKRFAPFSHDAGWGEVSEPFTLGLFGLGLAGIGLFGRRR